MRYKFSISEYNIFFDFDNTITTFDVLDDLIERFSINEDYKRWEKIWQQGKISSLICLKEQLKNIRITKKELIDYLFNVKIDSYFYKLYSWLREKKVKPVILSDSFLFLIQKILMNNKINDIKIYANNLKFYKDRLIPYFPYKNKNCQKCAHCKKAHLNNGVIKKNIYIGDGLSDICVASYADLVFAKDKLQDYLKKNKKFFIPFKSLKEVYEYLRGLEWRD